MQENNKYNYQKIQKTVKEILSDTNIYEYDPQNKNEKFCIILPPPNITGQLHLGHAWDVSLQDAIIRFQHLRGKNTLWISGLDHASIATQSKYEKILWQEQKKTKEQLGRKNFLKLLTDWSTQQANIIRKQWDSLCLSLSYKSQCFTMDQHVNKAVNRWFVDAYKKGLIYQSYKLVNWDTKLKTAISDIEVYYQKSKSFMYYFAYKLDNSPDYLTVATTRPETMFGDVCLFVNPNDQRYKKYVGQSCINPINGKKIPIYSDEYVQMDFGTGVMKCTPGHDFNDYALGLKYKLELINIMNDDGTLNQKAIDPTTKTSFADQTMSEARENVIKLLKQKKSFLRQEEIENNIAYSERTNEIVQPFLSKQWFVKMGGIAQQIIQWQTQHKGVTFFPPRFQNTLLTWMNNIQDWCISRQLWWGHQLPVWYHRSSPEKIYVDVKPPKDVENWIREDSVLDTWFSSGLWPMVCTFDRPEKEYASFFPVSVLVTAYDILFFWVARMISMTLLQTNQIPFHHCLIHGIVRDQNGLKMSKSLGNGIDPMKVIEKHGADALKMFLTCTSTMGEDLRYNEEKIIYYSTVLNKIWNCYQFFHFRPGQKIDFDKLQFNELDHWIGEKISDLRTNFIQLLNKYEFAVASKMLILTFWEVYCNQYLEYIKPQMDENQKNVALYFFLIFLQMFYPFCSNLSEYIYHEITSRLIWNTTYHDLSIPNKKYHKSTIAMFIDIESAIKQFRMKYCLSKKNRIAIDLITRSEEIDKKILMTLLNGHNIDLQQIKKENKITKKVYQLLITNGSIMVNIDQEQQNSFQSQLQKQLDKIESEIKRCETILSNQQFLKNANPKKIELEKQKYQNYLQQKNELLNQMGK